MVMRNSLPFFFALLLACVLFSGYSEAQSTVRQVCAQSGYPVYQGTNEVCSHTFQLQAQCLPGGSDLYASWSVIGNVSVPAGQSASFMWPWETEWIQIIGWTITDVTLNDNFDWWGIGSGYAPDMMDRMAPPQHSKTTFLPAGDAWYFPPIGLQQGRDANERFAWQLLERNGDGTG